jgi:hypothetical protein
VNRQDAVYVVEDGKARWTMVVDGEGTGRKIAGVAEWNGTSNSSGSFTTCRFDTKVRALDGDFWNSMARQINNTDGGKGLFYDKSDAYGVCEDGKAKLYIPAKMRVGYLPAHDVFGALIVIDKDGKITFDRNVEKGEHPGPVYPESLVKAQENSLLATGSWGDYSFSRGNVAFDDDSTAEFAGSENPNTGNTGQFMLMGDDGRPSYVTPMIPNKTSKMISRLSVVEADHAKAGKLNDLTFYTIPSRKSNAEVSQLVKAAFPNLSYASGIQIMEVAPGGDLWYGTIGQPLSATYSFTVDQEGSLCLYKYGSDKEIGCSDGEIVEGETPSVNPTTPSIPSTGEYAELTDKELADLLAQVSAEISRRSSEG